MQSQSRATTRSTLEDPEVELACLAADGGPLRRQLARIAGRLVATQAWDRLGFARLGDYGRERVGLSARELQELAQVDRALGTLPLLDEALVSGRLSWTKVRLLCRVASGCDERAWLELAESMSTRELARRVRAIESSARDGVAARGEFAARAEAAEPEPEDERRETLRVPCADRVHVKWGDVRRLVRRVSGEWLPFGVCAEYVAAEVISALPLEVEVAEGPDRGRAMPAQPDPARRVAVALPGARAAPSRFVAALAEGLEQADAFELDRRLRRAVALERGLLARMGPLLAAVADGRLFRSLGLNGLDAYARERLGMAPRKARALLRLERACRRSPPLARAWRSGGLSWSQAQTLVAVVVATGSEPWQEAWIERAGRVSVRRLEDDVDFALAADSGGSLDPAALPPLPVPTPLNPGGVQTSAHPRVRAEARYIRICAPTQVARLFRACLATVQLRIERLQGRPSSADQALEAMLDHVLDVWTQGERALSRRQRRARGVFERDAWRCTVPGCRSYRNLQAHHVRFRSRGGNDAPENLTTLCAAHHQRGVHGGRIRITGTAPGRLRFELPLETWRAGDVRVTASFDRAAGAPRPAPRSSCAACCD